MSRRKKIALAVCALIALCVSSWLLLFRPFEPRVQGRPLSERFEVAVTNFQERARTAEAIVSLKEEAVPYLRSELEQGTDSLSQKYLELWPKLPSELKRALPPPENHERGWRLAVELLEKIGPPAQDAMPELLAALEREIKELPSPFSAGYDPATDPLPPEPIHRLITVIGRIGSHDKEVVLKLLALTQESRIRLAGWASDGLGEFKNAARRAAAQAGEVVKPHVPPLVPAIKAATEELMTQTRSKDELVRREALLYLGYLMRDREMDFSGMLGEVFVVVAEDNHPDHRRAMSVLRGMKGQDEFVLLVTLEALNGVFFDSETTFSDMVFTSAPDVHRYAINPFSHIAVRRLLEMEQNEPKILPTLHLTLTHPKPRVRAGVCFVLGTIGERAASSSPKLASLAVQDPDILVRYQAALAAFKVSGNAGPLIPYKAAELKSAIPAVRLEAVRFLERHGVGSEEVVAKLQETAGSDPDEEVRNAARIALRTLQPR